MIEFRNVWKAFAGHEVLRGLNLTVARGEILFIIGASGVGKSVTIKLLIGLLKVDRGEVWLDGTRTDPLSEEALRPVLRAGHPALAAARPPRTPKASQRTSRQRTAIGSPPCSSPLATVPVPPWCCNGRACWPPRTPTWP